MFLISKALLPTDLCQYGLNSVGIIADVGGVYLNFGLWAIALIPGWLIVKEIGVTFGDRKLEREADVDHRLSKEHEQTGDGKTS